MIFNKKLVFPIALICSFFINSTIAANKVIVIPIETASAAASTAPVIEDNNSNTVGTVVGYESFTPLVFIADGSNSALVRVDAQNIATKFRAYYTSVDCSGSAYLESPITANSNSHDGLTGVSYGVGMPTSGTFGVLYKSTGGTSSVTYASAWISSNPPSGNCYVSGGTKDLHGTSTVTNLGTTYTAPLSYQ